LFFCGKRFLEGRGEPVVQLEEKISAKPVVLVFDDLFEGLLELGDFEVLVAAVEASQKQDCSA
jgi:hypothetical protein